MFAARNAILTGVSVVKDAFFNLVTLLLPGNGTNGAQNNTFLDSSTNNFTITRNGNTTQGTFSPFSQTGWGNFFGSGNYISAASNSAFALGTGDFTVEAWVYPTSAYTTFNYILGVAVTDGLVFYVTGGNLVVRAYNTGDLLSSSTIPQLNTWTHVAATRSGTTLRIFVNGVQTASTTNSTNFAQGAAYVGNDGTNAAPWYGYISNFRLVKGTAVYTAAFTPPTTPLTAITNTSLLTCQSNRFVDNSANAFAITVAGTPSVQAFSPFLPTDTYSAATVGGSGYFDGTGDYLSIADNAAFNLGTFNYTMEFWTYPTSFAANAVPFTYQWNDSGGTRLIAFVQNTNGTLTVYFYDATNNFTSTNTVQLNAWNHVALVRNSGNVFSLYINGVQGATSTVSISYPDSSNPIQIGASWNGSTSTAPYTGYISNTRVVIGTAVYTANFTPPTAPLTAVANTQLLCNFTNAGITDATSKNVLETVGGAQISTTQSKFGGSSMYFDGSGDFLTVPNNIALNPSSSNFTVEAWVYPLSLSGTQVIHYKSETDQTGIALAINNSGAGKVNFYSGNGGWYLLLDSSVLIPANAWSHIAGTRNGSTWTVWVNGVSGGTATSSTNPTDTTDNLKIGRFRTAQPFEFNGYISDYRFTKGVARYTTNFTPPASAFPLK